MSLKVYVRDGESIGQAMRRFQRSRVIRLGRKFTRRSLDYAEKPGQVRRRKDFMKRHNRQLWYGHCERVSRGQTAW
jgi:ribosomal protein S21